jgi:TIR domain-containing protein
MRKVFISHAASDKELADLLESLIETGIGVQHHEVFCSSLEGLGIPEGTQDFKEYIGRELKDCDTVIALISENYYASPFCMCELGAIWILAKNFFPILVPPVDFKDLRGALTGMQCRKLADPSTSSALYTRLSKLVHKPVPVERWDVKKEAFLRRLPKVLANLPKPQTVQAEEHARVKKESKGYKDLGVQLQEENDALKSEMKEIAKAKDANAIAEIHKKYSSEWDQFEMLLKACSKALAAVPRVIKEALFYWTRGEAFAPDYNEWDEYVRAALENDELTEDPHEEYHFTPNKERPKIQYAMKQIKALRRFLEEECSEELYEQATSEFGDTPDIKRRDFWQKHL